MLLAAPGCGKPSIDLPFEQVSYTQVGGVAGFDRTIQIAADGTYQVTGEDRTSRSGRLSGGRMQELRRLLQAVDWTDLKPEYIDRTIVDSLYQYISVRTARSENQVTVGTGGDVPPTVAALLALLDQVLREAWHA